jgi:hypothetical protein
MKGTAFAVAVPSKTNATPSFNDAYPHQISRSAMEPMRRKLVWAERQNFQGWACTECAWAFNPLGPPVGESIDEMKMHYEQQRDKEFTSHVCAEHPRATKNPRCQIARGLNAV